MENFDELMFRFISAANELKVQLNQPEHRLERNPGVKISETEKEFRITISKSELPSSLNSMMVEETFTKNKIL